MRISGNFHKISLAGISLLLLFISMYLLRALRDEMAVKSGVENLGWLMTLSFTLLCLLSLAFSFSSKTPLQIYRRFIVGFSVILIAVLVLLNQTNYFSGQLLFVLIGAANLLLISQFWKVLLGVFEKTEAKTAYPKIILIGSIGVILGPALVTLLAKPGLALILSVAILCVISSTLLLSKLRPAVVTMETTPVTTTLPKANEWPMAQLVLIYSALATLLYAEHIAIVDHSGLTEVQRLAFFGQRDMLIGLITLLFQWVSSGSYRSSRWLGFRMMPLITFLVLLAVGLLSSLEAVLWSMVVFKSFNYSYVRPAREVYYFNGGRGLKLKTVIDTVVYRIGDLIGIWLFQLLSRLEFDYFQIAMLLIPVIAFWAFLNQKIIKTLNA